jgi:quercetin dioxygenase-like cupin family protein
MLQVQRWDAARDGVLTASRVRQRFEAQGLWVSEGRFQPGAVHRAPAVGHDALQIVLCGLLKVTIAGDSVILAAGDTLFVPRGTETVLEVVGGTSVMAYLAAFLPHGPQAVRVAQPSLQHAGWHLS